MALSATPALAEERTLLALGDSLTQGFGLPEAEGFVPTLSRWLEGQGMAVRVINAGVSGDTTAGGAARIDWALSEDVDAVIVALGGNDVLRGIEPAVSRANLQRILESTAAQAVPVLLAGLPAPGNYGPDYKAEFDAIYPELAEAYGALLYPNFLAALSGAEDLAAAQRFMQADGIHPNADGVARIVDDIGPAVLALLRRVE